MHHPTDRIAHTTAFVTPVVEHWLEREIAQWVHPMKDRSDDPSHHERTLLPWSYISLLEETLLPGIDYYGRYGIDSIVGLLQVLVLWLEDGVLGFKQGWTLKDQGALTERESV